MSITGLKEYYGEIYNNAYYEIRKSVRDIRGYRVEEWSDFTDLVRG
ncbi:MAG: hypothetical protein J5932_09140 [Prevotella sp.]|nr:hypothetical protein [Prevotella sp.]